MSPLLEVVQEIIPLYHVLAKPAFSIYYWNYFPLLTSFHSLFALLFHSLSLLIFRSKIFLINFLLHVAIISSSSAFFWRNSPQWARASSFLRFLDQTQRRTTVGRTPLDEWSARRRDLYLTTHNNHKRQTSMPPVGFEPTIPASERPQTYVLDRTATGTGCSSSATCHISAPCIPIGLKLTRNILTFFCRFLSGFSLSS